LKPVKVLLVEDEVVTSIYLKMELTKIGCEVVNTLARGEDAIDAVDYIETGLILMDINLAGNIDGIEAARIIKEKMDMPIIFMTGYSDTFIQQRALSLNPLAFIVKPLNYLELKRIIENSFG